MGDVQGNNVLSPSLWGAEHSCFNGIAFVTSFAWVRVMKQRVWRHLCVKQWLHNSQGKTAMDSERYKKHGENIMFVLVHMNKNQTVNVSLNYS